MVTCRRQSHTRAHTLRTAPRAARTPPPPRLGWKEMRRWNSRGKAAAKHVWEVKVAASRCPASRLSRSIVHHQRKKTWSLLFAAVLATASATLLSLKSLCGGDVPRAVLPSLPWVVCFLSILSLSRGVLWQKSPRGPLGAFRCGSKRKGHLCASRKKENTPVRCPCTNQSS